MRNSMSVNVFSLLLPLLVLAQAQAEDLPVSLSIDAVTVYPRGAEVTRSGSVSFPAGSHRLIFTSLPADLDPARLQLAVNDSAVRLGSLQLETLHAGDLVTAEEQRLQTELEALQDARTSITDEVAGANTQLKFLDSLASNAGSQSNGIDAGALSGLLTTLASASESARNVIRDANGRLRQLDKEIARKQFELTQVATRQQVSNSVTVNVDVDSARSATVSLLYPVPQAGWNWLNEARLDTAAASLDLQRKVSVQQTSGEDWDNVQLRISTARPSANTQTPQLGSLLVDFLEIMPLQAQRPMALSARDAAVEEVNVSGAYLSKMDLSATQYLVEFAVPGRVSVAADSQPRLLPVDQRRLPVQLVTRVVPDRDSSAYLEARFGWEDSVPLQGGIMQFYRDNAFIGRRGVADFLPGEDIRLAFGRDDRIRVNSKAVQEDSRDGGVLRRNAVDEHRVRYELENFHATAVMVEVLGRIPVAQNTAIDVEWLAGATPVDEENVDGNAGVVLWRVTARPGQVASINHFYRVSYPRDNQLQYQDN